MKVAIVSGGKRDNDFILEYLNRHAFDCLIAVDSGLTFFYETNQIPNVIVGDFDSVDHQVLDFYQAMYTEGKAKIEICKLIPEKDDTDMEYAIRYVISHGATHITLFGATGTRIDHVQGNLHLLGIGLFENINIEIVDKNNRIRMIKTKYSIKREEQFGKYISLLPVTGDATGVTLSGFKYPLRSGTIPKFSSLGVSNEITEEVGSIQIEDGILLLIESRD